MNQSPSAPFLDDLADRYARSTENLREALRNFIQHGTRPDPEWRASGAFTYPELRIHYAGDPAKSKTGRAWGRLGEAGSYAVSVTQPALFRDYLAEQLDFLLSNYDIRIEIGQSAQEIPFAYVLGDGVDVADVMASDLVRSFPAPELAHIGDEVADGVWIPKAGEHHPLALFDALRTDFSLARLRHYTGTAPEHFQRYILFTNYQRYVDHFIRWGVGQVQDPESRFTGLAGAGGMMITGDYGDAEGAVADSTFKRFQMPAYHLIGEGGTGITLVNIGVGPSNAKTITDHLGVLRPEAWMMIGHCGGLRSSQKIGDYVLAHAYLRDDHILDAVLPAAVPIPPIAEVQQALQQAALTISGEDEEALKERLRTGTVVTTGDRNWELRYSSSALLFNQSRAVAIDMESATIAAQGYRFRVPYGTLLCISDKPLHGEIKLPGQANRFYERAIEEHVRIAILACDLMRQNSRRLHSRKLRAFNEPAFR
ncbi:AMP nucleosidase [Sphingosinicella sp. YJ22]|uniref:AMP nucleosidase n=1 Tax=Sphingosinicella sp. YJ22 TaxID=1104780 RepID=UPI0014075D79|nr:AMP nucleosidase [Sphingosinicella sp. YJ22]